MKRMALRLVIAIALCVTLGTAVYAQRITASVRGKVADANGSVIPNAKVTAVQHETNFTKTVTSGGQGEYYLGGLPAGHYDVTAEAAGFEKLTWKVDLTVGIEAGLDFAMKVGSVNTQVDVSAEGQLLEPTKTDLGSTITTGQVDNLPTINRDFSSLALLVPGVTPGVGGNGPSLAVNGQRGYQNNVFIDGVSNQWQYYGRQASTLSQDWIQEFQVMTNSYSAEFGNASGGILNVITRSGTNDWHGRGYFFYRNKAFDADPFAGNLVNGDPQFVPSSQIPDYTQWRWGVSAGGPIIKDKLFIFAGFEKLDLNSSAELAISPYWVSQGFKNVLPVATTDRPYLIRGDYNINGANHLSVRYDRTIQKSVNEGGPFQVQDGRDTFGGPVWNLVANLTTTINNTNLNEFRAGYLSNEPPIVCNQSGTGGTAELAKGPPGTFANINYPTMTIGCPIFDGTEGEQDLKLSDTYSIVKGRHQFKFGADVRKNVLNDNITNFHEGYWAMDLSGTDLAFDINNPASYPYVFEGNTGQNAFKLPIWNYSLFAQDTWKITDGITLDLGIRYDVDRSATAGNQFIDAKNTAVVDQYGGNPPLKKTQVDYNNISPRLGIVWAPTADRRTTLHAAFGFFYDQNHGNFNAIYIINSLLSSGFTVVNCTSPVTNPYWNGGPTGVAQCQGALAQAFPFFPKFPGIAAPSQGLDTLDPNLQIPRTTQFTAGVAHEFEDGLLVSADFVRSNGSGLEYIDQVQKLPDGSIQFTDPRFSYVDSLTNVGYVHYTALEIQAKYRKNRANLDVSYTLSKAYSDLVTGSVFGSSPTNPLDLSQDAGPDPTDQRHNLVVNGAYDLPWGFQVAGIGTYRSPLPWSSFTNQNPTGAFFPSRPEPKDSHRGDDYKGVDLRLTKEFKFRERYQARVFWEMYNMFNSLNYTSYNNLIDNLSTFGQPTAASDMRRQQLGVRIDF
ncbi:MAG TPA: TonB-dependent receptor [Candidatus Koribacter sp.]